MTDSVMTLGCYPVRQADSLDRAAYEIVRNSILKNLLAHGVMTSEQLGARVGRHLKKKFHGSLLCYYEAVRRELELCGEIHVNWKAEPPLITIVA